MKAIISYDLNTGHEDVIKELGIEKFTTWWYDSARKKT